MDKYNIDSHKLMLHVKRVNDWLDGKNVYPIYAEISPSGSCNHRCTYCALDFMEYKPRTLETKMFKNRLAELGKLGLKSIMFAGEGEPFLHRDMADITVYAKKCGIDVSFTTNGVLMTPKITDRILKHTSWIKVSINAGTKKTYSKIHRTRESDFQRVIENMSYAAMLKRKKGYDCTLGMQIVLLPENAKEILTLAKLAKKIGMNYLVVKPYSQHPQSITSKYKNIKYKSYEKLAGQLEKLNDDKFVVVFRQNTMQKWDKADKSYERCFALPFWTYIDAGGNVWGCSMFLNDNRFLYGNIYKNTFKQIWNGAKRKKSLKMVCEKMDAGKCRINCRMDEVNKYLWKLKNPPAHVNFI
jgi:GTP 3',8-cyclase